MPGGADETAQFPAVRDDRAPAAYQEPQQGDTGSYPVQGGSAPQQFQRPGTSRPGGPPPVSGPGSPHQPGYPAPGGQQGQHGRHGQGGPEQQGYEQPYGQPGGRPPARQEPLPPAEPMALPPAPTRGDEPTPIFSAIESDWFRTGQAERMQQIHVNGGNQGNGGTGGEPADRGQQAPPRPVGRTAPPQRRPAPGTQRPQSSGPGGPQPAATAQTAPSAPVAQPLPRETPNWRTSPNDELRQRAEAIRQPAAGGVTPSGLPRRIPRANLVAGGATQQQTPQGGPQVSRSPDDVRGRLTNLRRGIQQGRQAGGSNTDGRGFGMNNQER
jgi:hypothetical protein